MSAGSPVCQKEDHITGQKHIHRGDEVRGVNKKLLTTNIIMYGTETPNKKQIQP